MEPIYIDLESMDKKILHLGFVGENDYTRVIFQCESMFAKYPAAVPALSVRPPKGQSYPVIITRDGNNVIWDVKSSSLTVNGSGEVQLSFVEDEKIAKSYCCKTDIKKSIIGEGTPPDPLADFILEAETALDGIPEQIAEALQAAKDSHEFDGQDGVSPTVTTSTVAGGTSVNITDRNGNHEFIVRNGQDGISPDITVTDIPGGHRVQIVDVSGTNTFDIPDGNPATIIDDTAGEGDTNKTFSADKLHADFGDVLNAIQGVNDAIYQVNSVDVSLTISEGEYYKLTGKHSTYNQAKCSQVIPVTAGSKVYVTSKSQASVAGIIFYDSDTPSDNSFVSYDCYTGETVTYTNQEVTVPVSATHCIVQGNISSPLALKKRETINKIDKNTTDIAALQLDEEKVDDAYNAVFEEEHTSVELTMTEGKYYKLTGKYGTYDQAKCSQVIEVTAGEKVYVTAKSQASVAGILFYNSSTASESTFVSYDCYTGETVTFTEQEVTVPVGATHAVVQGNINSTVALERIGMGDKVQKNTQDIVGIKNDDEYMASVLRQRFMAIAKNFSWGSYPKMIISLRVDDLRTDIDLFAKIITGEYGFPLDIAACVKNIDKTVTGIVDPAEKIGDTRLEVCQWVQEHGGEVLVHPDTTFADATKIKELFLDSKRTFEDNGIHIRGTAVANSTPDATLKAKLDPYLYLYYDFSDAYGTNPPYNGMTFTMMNNFNNDIDDFESWLNTRTAYQTPVWVTLVMHEIGVDVTETFLRDVLDLIQTNVTQGKVAVMLWSEVYDTYGTF